LPLWLVVVQRVRDAMRKSGHGDGMQTGVGAGVERGPVLTQREDEESAVVGEQRQEREHLEPAVDDDHVVEGQGQPKGSPPARAEERGQAVSHAPPEHHVVEQTPGRSDDDVRVVPSQPAMDQLRFGSANQVGETDVVLPGFRACTVRGHVQRHAVRLGLGDQGRQVVASEQVHCVSFIG